MQYLDQVTYLPENGLAKVDRASMAVGLKVRVPLLDHCVAAFSWSIPLSAKLGPNGNKWILRELLYRYLTRELVDRPKSGFLVPIDAWLRGPLRNWAEELLNRVQFETRRLRVRSSPSGRLWKAGTYGFQTGRGLSTSQLNRDGFLDPTPIRSLWSRFLAGAGHPWDHSLLWDILTFQSWAERHLGARVPPSPFRRPKKATPDRSPVSLDREFE